MRNLCMKHGEEAYEEEADLLSSSDEDEEDHKGSRILQNPQRKRVDFSFSIHSVSQAPNGMAVHLVLKFKYDESLIEDVFWAEKPTKNYIKQYDQASHHLFPYCLYNTSQQTTISYCYENKDGRVLERVELQAVFTYVDFSDYFPFVLQLLSIKVGSDGTAGTGLVNLVPETLPGTQIPNADLGCFCKSTSDFSIGGSDEKTIKDHVCCRMFVRDLSNKTMGNYAGIYTRAYLVVFFQPDYIVHLFEYILLPLFILQVTIFLAAMEVGDLIQTALAMAFADFALLFTIPYGNTNPATMIIISQAMYFIAQAMYLAHNQRHVHWDDSVLERHVIISNIVVTFLSLLGTGVAFIRYKRLAKSIRHKFLDGTSVGRYDEVDDLI